MLLVEKAKGHSLELKGWKIFYETILKKNKTNQGYFLKCDVKKCFQSIDHNILAQYLRKSGLYNEDMWFIDKLLESRYSENGIGLPIGNQTSQWFGLFYLNSIDRLIKEKLRIKYYVRYMDDMILLHHDKEYLKYCKQVITEFVETQLNLSLNKKLKFLNLIME